MGCAETNHATTAKGGVVVPTYDVFGQAGVTTAATVSVFARDGNM